NGQVHRARPVGGRGEFQAGKLSLRQLPDAGRDFGARGERESGGHAADDDARDLLGTVGGFARTGGDAENRRRVLRGGNIRDIQEGRVDNGIDLHVHRVGNAGRVAIGGFGRRRRDDKARQVHVAVGRRGKRRAAREAVHARGQGQRPGAGRGVIRPARSGRVHAPARLDAADGNGQKFGAVGVVQARRHLQRDGAVF